MSNFLLNVLDGVSGKSFVKSYADFASFPANGFSGYLYLDLATGSLYYWNGSSYQQTLGNAIEDLWGYQDFAAGAITGTSVTLTANENGTGATFDPATFFNYASIYDQDGLDYVYSSGFLGMFSGIVKVTSQSAASITLNKIPANTENCRIWYRYLGVMPSSGYIIPPQNILDAAGVITLGDEFFIQKMTTAPVDEQVVVADGVTGSKVKATPVKIDSSGNITDVVNLTLSGNQTFTGTAKRIIGDFSNTTRANRFSFQTSTTNGNTLVQAIPNGTGTVSGFLAYGGSDPDNASYLQTHADDGNHVGLNSAKMGTGVTRDLVFQIDGVTKAKVTSTGQFQTTQDASINGITAGRGNGSVATNTVFGASAAAVTTGSTTTVIGANSLQSSTNASTGITIVGSANAQNTTAIGNNTVLIGSGIATSASFTATNNTIIGAGAATALTTGDRHVIIGSGSGTGLIDSGGNVLIGYQVGINANANNNNAIGLAALQGAAGGNNVCQGTRTLQATTGSGNTAIGYEALKNILSGGGNVAIGQSTGSAYVGSETSNIIIGNSITGVAGESSTIRIGTVFGWVGTNLIIGSSNNNLLGTSNVGLGYLALNGVTGTTTNTAVGAQSQQRNATGTRNTSLGNLSLIGSSVALDVGNDNTVIGNGAGLRISTSQNTVVGSGSLNGGTTLTGNNNCIFGYASGTAYTTSEANNIIIGASITGTAAESNVIRIGNSSNASCYIRGIASVSVSNLNVVTIDTSGHQLGSVATTGTGNVIRASNAVFATDITVNSNVVGRGGGNVLSNIVCGYRCLTNNAGANGSNIIIGYVVAENATAIGSGNTLVGSNMATSASFTGLNNTGLGSFALQSATGATSCVAIGQLSQANFTGSGTNTAVGNQSLQRNITGTRNTAIGNTAMIGTNAVDMGNDNVAVGEGAFLRSGGGSFNVAIGSASLNGSQNTISQMVAVGYATGSAYNTTEANNICIGYNVNGTAGESNVIRLGNSSHTSCFIRGINGVSSSNLNVVTIDSSTSQLGAVSVTGTGNVVRATSPTFTTQITTPTAIFTGAANQALNVNTNSGSAYTIDPANGTSFNITLNAATPVITLQTPPATTISQELLVNFIQDGTGGRVPSFSGVTWVNGYAPSVLQAVSAVTQMKFWYSNGICYGSAPVIAVAPVTSTLAIGSATSLTSTTAKTITSITLTAGSWIIFGNIGFISASGTIITQQIASISTTTNTHATSPNGGAYAESNATQTATTTPVLPTGCAFVAPTSTTTYYLVGTSTFSVSTLTAYGSITAIPQQTS